MPCILPKIDSPPSVLDSRLSCCDISSDHIQVVAGGFERLLGFVVRNKSGVVVKGHIAFPAQAVKDDQQTGMFLVHARTHKVDDSDVVPRLTSRTESMAEHEPEGSFEHCFIGLLKASFFVKGENSMSRVSFLSALARKRSIWPSQPRAVLASSFGPTSGIRLLCQTFSTNASFRARRDANSFGVRTV